MVKVENFNNNNKIISLFNEINKSIEDMKIKNKDIIDDYIINLFKYFDIVFKKVSINKWKYVNYEKFIEKFKLFLHNDDFVNLLYCIEFIKIYDVVGSRLLNLSDEYLKLFVKSISIYEDLDISLYKKIYEYLSLQIIKNIIDKKDTFKNKLNTVINIIELIECGYDPITINMLENNCIEELDNLDIGIITIDRIYNYYINQVTGLINLNNNIISKNIVNNINKILLIKSYSNMAQNKFIELIKEIRKCSKSLIEQLTLISNLIEIFLYLDKKIEKISIDSLYSILFDKKAINDDTIKIV